MTLNLRPLCPKPYDPESMIFGLQSVTQELKQHIHGLELMLYGLEFKAYEPEPTIYGLDVAYDPKSVYFMAKELMMT